MNKKLYVETRIQNILPPCRRCSVAKLGVAEAHQICHVCACFKQCVSIYAVEEAAAQEGPKTVRPEWT
jgi:hypothetical protein